MREPSDPMRKLNVYKGFRLAGNGTTLTRELGKRQVRHMLAFQ